MISIEEVYISFQQARARNCNRPYRVPKDWDKVWAKLIGKQMYNLEMVTVAFNTRWQNVNMDKYFDCGFKLFGNSFSFLKFYDRRILTMYINEDKQQKRKEGNVKTIMTNSLDFIHDWMGDKQYRSDISMYSQYCRMNDNGMRAPIKHYINNDIDKHTLSWLICQKYLVLEDTERGLIPLVIENYWTLSAEAIACMKEGE
jgi:hypothetical protein